MATSRGLTRIADSTDAPAAEIVLSTNPTLKSVEALSPGTLEEEEKVDEDGTSIPLQAQPEETEKDPPSNSSLLDTSSVGDGTAIDRREKIDNAN